MSTMIAFSGAAGDCIYVEEDLDAVSLARIAYARSN